MCVGDNSSQPTLLQTTNLIFLSLLEQGIKLWALCGTVTSQQRVILLCHRVHRHRLELVRRHCRVASLGSTPARGMYQRQHGGSVRVHAYLGDYWS